MSINVALLGLSENHSYNSKILCSIKAAVMPLSFQVGQCCTHYSHIINKLLNYLHAWFICSQLYLGKYLILLAAQLYASTPY